MEKLTIKDLKRMSNDELIDIIIKTQIELEHERRLGFKDIWFGKGIHQKLETDFEIVDHLKDIYPVAKLCSILNVNRSSYYSWKSNLNKQNSKLINRNKDIELFKKFHKLYPTHGYRWLNAKIELVTGRKFSNKYAQRCCMTAGIRSKSRKYRYSMKDTSGISYPNLLKQNMSIVRPYEVIVSDMTSFISNKVRYEFIMFVDLFNYEILSYSITTSKNKIGPYIQALKQLIKIRNTNPKTEMMLHTDQGTAYASYEFNKLLDENNIKHSMSRPGVPQDNGAMESINGWVKDELVQDFKINESTNPKKTVEDYIKYYNTERPSYSLNYLTPKAFKDKYLSTL